MLPLVLAAGVVLAGHARFTPVMLIVLLALALRFASGVRGPRPGPAPVPIADPPQDADHPRDVDPLPPDPSAPRPSPIQDAEPGLERTVAPGSTRQVRLAGPGLIGFIAVVGLGVFVLGAYTLFSAAVGRNLVPASTSVRIIGSVIGGGFTLLGAFFLYGAARLVRTGRQALDVDGDGIRRVGVQPWVLTWSEVQAAQIAVRESTVRRRYVPPPRVIELRLQLAPGSAERVRGLTPTSSHPPFTHTARLPDGALGAPDPVAALDRALRAYAGPRYAGVVEG